jgi:adenylate cyclase
MSLEEFAALVRTEASQIAEWVDAGLLDPEHDERFDDLDLLRLMAIRHYEALGYDPPRLGAAIASGEVEPFLGEYTYPREARLTIEEASKRTGIELEALRELLTSLGWARPWFVEGDLRALEGFKVIGASGMPPEATVEGARVFGDTLRRLAETLVRLVHVHIHERLIEEGVPEDEVIRRIHGLQEAALPLLDGIVERVFHEHLLQADIEDAYVHLVDTDPVGGRGSVEAAIVFIDVESFTTLTETRGDQVAIDVMSRLDSVVRSLALERDGKVVKTIGDALMLAFRDPASAATFAAAVHEGAERDPDIPGLRIGIHCGPAVYRAGDYLGATVNLASRVTGTATAGQTVLTQAVAEKLGDGAPVAPLSVRLLRGAERPVQLYRLTRHEERRDPTCGRSVESPPAARLRRDGEELWFCSEDCLRDYLASSPAAADGISGAR